MQNLLDHLEKVLLSDNRLNSEGRLLKNKIVELAIKYDEELLDLLLQDMKLKDIFFIQVGKVYIFKKEHFIQFINNKEFLPDSYTAFRNEIGLFDGSNYLSEYKRDVVLAWPYKDTILQGGQTKEDSKREEIFWNKILAPEEINRLIEPKVFTNMKRIDQKGTNKLKSFEKDKNGEILDNLVIKGNNLLALYSIKKKFRGKVKLIYIDPPFNTGNDSFKYNDHFNHSTWLTFMKNRLDCAKELLSEDGVICVHCDYIEEFYLKVLMDEIFGKDNFVNSITIRDSHPSGLKLSAREKTIIKTKSTILVYKKDTGLKVNPIYQARSDWDTHFNSFVDIDSRPLNKVSLNEYLKNNSVISDQSFVLNDKSLNNPEFRKFAFNNRDKIFQSTKELPDNARKKSLNNKGIVIEYEKGEYAFNGRRLSPLSKSIYDVGFDGYRNEDFAKLLCDFWDDVDFNNSQSEGDVSFPSGKKPEFLLARLLTMFTNSGDLVLDFFLGSGTTAAVAHKMKRQYIGIEQMDYEDDDSVNRLRNVINGDKSGISKFIDWMGGGEFVYLELAKWNEIYVEKIKNSNNKKYLNELLEEILKRAQLSYIIDIKKAYERKEYFENLSMLEKKKFLLEIINKNHLYINLSEIEDPYYEVCDSDKELNVDFYGN